jgi:hypothetical protein
MLRQRSPRQHDNKRLEFIRSLPCCICADDTTTEAAHIRMTVPHGLAGKAYVGTLYALLIIASLIALAVVAFGPFWIVVMIGAVMAVGFIGFIFWLAPIRRQPTAAAGRRSS